MRKKGVQLEERIIDAIQRTLVMRADIAEAMEYFEQVTVNDMIDEAVGE